MRSEAYAFTGELRIVRAFGIGFWDGLLGWVFSPGLRMFCGDECGSRSLESFCRSLRR